VILWWHSPWGQEKKEGEGLAHRCSTTEEDFVTRKLCMLAMISIGVAETKTKLMAKQD